MTTQTPQLSLKADFEGNLNVRCSPGTDPAHTIIGGIAEGSKDLFDILGKNAAAATWYQIRYPGTTSGWVSQEFVQSSDDLSGLPVTWPAPKLNRGPTVKGLNVYAGPGTSHDRLAFIKDPEGAISPTQYIILGIDAAAAWYRICVRNLVTGWVRAAYVQTHGDLRHLPIDRTLPQLSLAANAPPEVNVHATPDASQALGIFIRDSDEDDTPERYLILGKDADTAAWYRIRVNNTVTGWVRAAYVQTHGDLDNLPVAWQPPLPADSLELPVRDQHGNPIPISSLFNDPRRWWRPQVGVPLRHEGIDWACPIGRPVRAMIGGTVKRVRNKKTGVDPFGYGYLVTVESELEGRTFQLTYAHLSDVTVEMNEQVVLSDPKTGKPTQLGLSGSTGQSTGPHLHVHYDPQGDVNWLDFFESGNYQDFHAALPQGIYHWPDITDLQADIDAASETTRDGLVRATIQWMDNALRYGTDPDKPRLRVKRGGAVYMLPQADKRFKYPCRPFPGSTVTERIHTVRDLSRSDTGTALPPDWWRIKINESFQACWVRHEDAVVIGNRQEVPRFSPYLSEDPPRYLQKDNGTNVRRHPRIKMINEEGELVAEDAISPKPVIDGWVPITDLACDEITGDYLWYEIPYDTDDSSARGWVRGDVAEKIKGILSEEEKETIPEAFSDIEPVVPESPTIAGVETKKEVVAFVHDQPRDRALKVATLQGFAEATAQISLSPTWYQVRFGGVRRGWVQVGQVQTYHTDGLNTAQPRLRRWPGHTAAVPVRRGPADGETVLATIAADSTAWHDLLGRDAAYPGWYRIRFSNTVTGWVRADETVEIQGNLNSAPPPQVGLANPAQACVVRSQPTATATELVRIAAGSTGLHPVLERDAVPAAWYRIRFSDTVTGWVSAACVQLHGDGRNLPVRPQASLKPTVTDGVRVRRGPGTEHAWIGSIPGGSTVRYDILGQDADPPLWWQIQFSDTVVGWVHKDYMLTHGSLEHLAETWIPQLSPRADATAGLNVHAGPGAHHRLLVTLPAGATRYYDILGKDAATAAWYQIRVSALLIGWVPREYVQTRGPLADLLVTWTGDPQVDADPAAESGTSLNQAEHHNGTYTLDFDGSNVSAEFSSSASPVQYYARADQGRAPVFRILDPDLRPAEKAVLSTDTAREVNRDGSTKTGGMPRTLKLEVHTDGNVHYADEGLRQIGYLGYNITGSWTPAGAVPRERGASLNQTEHHDGDYTLTVRDDAVHAVFASSSSPVQYFARADQGRAPVFRIADTALRPAATTTLTVTGAQEVNRDGTPKTGGVDRTFKLEVHTDGNVHYVDEDVRDIGYLGYRATGSWPLAPVETPAAPVPRPPATRPVLESGTSLNQTEHREGDYTLTRGRDNVAAAFSSASSPVQYFARADQGRAPVFRIAAPALRPAARVVLSTDTAQEVNRDGTPKTGGLPRTLKLEVQPNGEVHYVDEGLRQIGYLKYRITGSWTPAADTADDDTGTGTPPTGTPNPAPSPQPTPAPVPARPTRPTRERGTSLNQTEHRSGTYTLDRSGNTLAAAFAAASSPVQYFARADQGRAPVFRIASPALRPQAKVVLTTTAAREVDRDGIPRPGAADRPLKLEVHTNGKVYYADEGLRDVGYLKYRVTGSWDLAAPDPATPQLSLLAAATYNLNVRSGPGTVHDRVGFLRRGSATRYHILGKDTATAIWYQIQFSPTVTGWVHKDHVQTHGNLSGLAVTWNPPQLSLLATTTYNLNVRSGPGTSHNKVGFIPGGSATRYDILGKDAATPVWWRIWFSSSVIGWVHGNYVQTHGDVGGVPVR